MLRAQADSVKADCPRSPGANDTAVSVKTPPPTVGRRSVVDGRPPGVDALSVEAEPVGRLRALRARRASTGHRREGPARVAADAPSPADHRHSRRRPLVSASALVQRAAAEEA